MADGTPADGAGDPAAPAPERTVEARDPRGRRAQSSSRSWFSVCSSPARLPRHSSDNTASATTPSIAAPVTPSQTNPNLGQGNDTPQADPQSSQGTDPTQGQNGVAPVAPGTTDPQSNGQSGQSNGQSGQSGQGSTTQNNPAAAAVTPGLVDIVSTIGYDGSEGAGTGIILSSDGLVLTNHHVVAGSTSITVTAIATGKVVQGHRSSATTRATTSPSSSWSTPPG